MCGIVGLISPAIPISDNLLVTMRDRLVHRGPDSGNQWIHPNRRLGMAHRRLSIIDRSHAADQPMRSADQRNLLVFNGEIYNYIELRQELEREGVGFRTRSDTEVLLAALSIWGEAAIGRLNGMFSFVYWDDSTKRMLVARDRFGEKPLFVGKGAFHVTVFASEMKAILAHPMIAQSVNETSIERFGYGSWYEDDGETFFSAIERFPAAHAAWYGMDGSEIRRWRYWTPDYDDVDNSVRPREAVEEFSRLLRKSIQLRLRADVPVGSSLSGGLDSSVVVGFLAEERAASSFTQNTFSACFPSDPTLSEEPEIDAVVEHTGVNSYKVEPDPIELMKESQLLHWHQEEPFLSASIYLQWCVARLAKETNTIVVLDGQGADELLAGYQFYFRQRQLDLLDQRHYEYALRESMKFNRRLNDASKQYQGASRRFNSKSAFSERELRELWRGGKLGSPSHNPAYKVGVAEARTGMRLRRTISEALLYNSLPMLLRYADRNSMAFSREARLPYLDYELVDFCIKLPDEFYIRNGWQKWVLRQAAGSTIPSSIRWRADKVGYAAPLDLWLRNELRSWAEERVNDARLRGIPGFDADAVKKAWDEHQNSVANNSWFIWKWISLVEWLELRDLGWWRAGVCH